MSIWFSRKHSKFCLFAYSFQPDFSDVPLTTGEEVDNWLKFYNMKSTLVCVGELVSHDPVSQIDVYQHLNNTIVTDFALWFVVK